jgi:C-terminal processing protease CtpA/Prc
MLRDNINIKDYYVSNNSLSKIPTFKNETGFNTFDHGILSHRLLTLFSFWNVIQYHYVNKYLMDVNWMHQLNSYVNKFISCDSELEYEKLKSELIASINDSHAYYLPHIINDSLFKYKPPFGTTLVNDTLVVSSLFNKNIAEKDDLKLGDLILEVRNMNIKSNIEDIVNPILSSSNKSFLKKWSRWILFNNENSINIKIKRKDSIINKSLNLYHDYEIKGYSLLKSFSINEKWKLIEGNIGYINLNSISKKELKNAFEEFSKAKGVIVDLRNYPKYVSESDITKYIYPNKIRFVNVLFPIPNRPSLAKFEESPLSIIKDPFKSGNRNSKYYDKPIILLVNSTTQSKAEYIGMAIQASPNCITVGEETAGSVMNVATFTLPDKSEVSFTSLGAFYPEGTGVQRKGLKIDYFIDENTSNFTKDQYIIKGIELIKSMNAED